MTASNTIKVAMHETFGAPEVLRIAEIEAAAPAAGQIRIAVYASAVTRGDLRLRAADFPGIGWLPGRLMFGFRRPKHPVAGSNFAGRVLEVGPGVTRFAVGDDVFGTCDAGAYAESLVVDADGPVARLPEGLAHAEVAATPYGLVTAAMFLEGIDRVQPGERVAIVGAAGGVGRYAVQLARHLGARVTAVCGARDAEQMRALGAERVVDYAREDFTAGARYDVIFDTANALSFGRVKRALDVGGRFLTVQLGVKVIAQMLWTGLFGDRKAKFGVAMPGAADMQRVAELLESGAVKPQVARRFPLDAIVEAHTAAEAGRQGGDIVVEVRPAASLKVAA